MVELSPAARAVFEAFNRKFEWIEDGVPGPQFHAIAAALRAVADEVEKKWRGFGHDACQEIRAIATELENQP
jgi:hypothetical protein